MLDSKEAFSPETVPEESLEQAQDGLIYHIGQHIFDTEPLSQGEKKDLETMGDALTGAINAKVWRPEPPLDVKRVLFHSGKSYVVVGKNGTGKSTFFDAFMEKDNARFDSGSHRYKEGVHGRKSLRIGRLNQEEFLGQIGTMKSRDVLLGAIEKYKRDFPIDWENLDKYDENMQNQAAHQRVEELLWKMQELFEIDIFLDRKVEELSGGERTKLSLAVLLASEPDILFLDEPTNHLDLESIAKLVGLFKVYQNAGVSIVSASHVEWFLDLAGKDGTIELKLEDSKRSATQSQSAYKDYVKKERHETSFIKPIEWDTAYSYPFSSTTVFTTDTTTTLPNSPIKDTEVPTVHGGEITMFSGKNGTGKTKIMEEMVKKGSHYFRKEKGLQVAYMPQFWPEEITQGSVEDFFNWVKDSTNPHSEKTAERFRKQLGELGFRSDISKLLRTELGSLSGGEQRLVWFVAVSVLEGTDMLVLDEPTNHMDKAAVDFIAKAIESFPGGVVLSTHDLRLMEKLGGNKGENKHGVVNWVFERAMKGVTSISVSKESPFYYSNQVIQKAMGKAGTVQL
jgi:ATPase subunit of ABC transporter with duplicated ATPase domains